MQFYQTRAENGPGLIIIGGASVDKIGAFGPGELLIHGDKQRMSGEPLALPLDPLCAWWCS